MGQRVDFQCLRFHESTYKIPVNQSIIEFGLSNARVRHVFQGGGMVGCMSPSTGNQATKVGLLHLILNHSKSNVSKVNTPSC